MKGKRICRAATRKKGRVAPPRPLTKEEKTWFFLLCGRQPKINLLIFPVCYPLLSANRVMT
ncbi:hypothetical protein MC70_006270 [Serratia marcescens]|uniref:Uncharacterized protein n=1 Tax=Serratia marcescens TaxID=615 RepID=A0AAP8PHG8_SERMA|nr:hypothetical protein MC70_006270 [Serratia marcescens]